METTFIENLRYAADLLAQVSGGTGPALWVQLLGYQRWRIPHEPGMGGVLPAAEVTGCSTG